MGSDEQPRESIPEHFESIEAAAEFWDGHDLGDYEDQTTEAEFSVRLVRRRHLVALDPDLAARLAREASRRGLSAETLVNLWLSQRLAPAADSP